MFCFKLKIYTTVFCQACVKVSMLPLCELRSIFFFVAISFSNPRFMRNSSLFIIPPKVCFLTNYASWLNGKGFVIWFLMNSACIKASIFCCSSFYFYSSSIRDSLSLTCYMYALFCCRASSCCNFFSDTWLSRKALISRFFYRFIYLALMSYWRACSSFCKQSFMYSRSAYL